VNLISNRSIARLYRSKIPFTVHFLFTVPTKSSYNYHNQVLNHGETMESIASNYSRGSLTKGNGHHAKIIIEAQCSGSVKSCNVVCFQIDR